MALERRRADALTATITDITEVIGALQQEIADEYQAARADGFDPATADSWSNPGTPSPTPRNATSTGSPPSKPPSPPPQTAV